VDPAEVALQFLQAFDLDVDRVAAAAAATPAAASTSSEPHLVSLLKDVNLARRPDTRRGGSRRAEARAQGDVHAPKGHTEGEGEPTAEPRVYVRRVKLRATFAIRSVTWRVLYSSAVAGEQIVED
jgi:hypothetical protein